MSLSPVHPDLIKAGYRRPSVEEFTAADPERYKAEGYDEYFANYEEDLLKDVREGKVTFNLNTSEEVEVEEAEVAPTVLPPPPPTPAPTPKPRRPSWQYPGFYEPD